jgi:cobalamin-dependent methionine synthase I
VWRYAGYRGDPPDEESELHEILQEVIAELPNLLSCRLCYREFSLSDGDFPFSCDSEQLKNMIDGCERIVLFAVTLGLNFDRYLLRYSRAFPVKALLLQALGGERAEALAEHFCCVKREEYQKQGYTITRRFSPGYGDWPLRGQKEIMELLQCHKNIGVTLNESFLMTPTKSITAVFGIKESKQE